MAGWTLAQLEALETAIAQGARSVQYKDRKVEYHSLKEMQDLRNQMRRDLGITQNSQTIFPRFSKGLD